MSTTDQAPFEVAEGTVYFMQQKIKCEICYYVNH
jgi:hypothetical protein